MNCNNCDCEINNCSACAIGDHQNSHCITYKTVDEDSVVSTSDIFDKSKMQVNYCLQEAYKIAVHLAGITDWSRCNSHDQEHVEDMQLAIAQMLNDNLNRYTQT